MVDMEIRRTLQGHGFVVFKNGNPVAVAHKCIGDNQTWSLRIAGARFEMDTGRRFLASNGRKYDEMTYIDAPEKMVAILAVQASRRRRKVLDCIYVPGTKAA